jgi:hypothetical protein
VRSPKKVGFLGALVGAVAMATMVTGPTLAAARVAGAQMVAATYRPDASIHALTSHYVVGSEKFTWSYGTAWFGVGVYNTTATNQVAAADWQRNCCNEKHAFSIAIKNNGNASDHFKVKATGTGLGGWSITYFKGSTNITSAVVAGTYTTPSVSPGSEVVLTAKMSGVSGSEIFKGSRLVTVTSAADPAHKDAVRFQLHKATWCYC